MLQKLGIEEGEAITHPWVNKALEKAQMRVEARNYDIRKHLLKFDDVMNDQRKVIYAQRAELMTDKDISEEINDMRHEVVNDVIFGNVPENTPSEFWDYKGINEQLAANFGADISLPSGENLTRDNAVDLILEKIKEKIKKKEEIYPSQMLKHMERAVLLRLIDQYWKEHLLNLDRLRQGINLRAYGQRDPLNEYKQEAFALFEMMSATIRKEAVRILSLFELPTAAREDDLDAVLLDNSRHEGVEDEDEALPSPLEASRDAQRPCDNDSESCRVSSSPFETSRNAPCPCGSEKKYKHCCGKIEE
ncbi:MAG: SEC-C domain-containing protein [Holosporaceae bacterium]|nr:SEC-C domain-containing protein [Holosporaceae bacterium]